MIASSAWRQLPQPASSPARIPSHLLNEALSCACRSLSVVWEIDRDSPRVNIVWQTMNKDISLSWIKHDSAPHILKSCWKCTMTSHWMRKPKRYLEILPTQVSASLCDPRDTQRDKFIGCSLSEEKSYNHKHSVIQNRDCGRIEVDWYTNLMMEVIIMSVLPQMYFLDFN